MYIYNFNWSYYDGREETILLHRVRYSKGMFKDICYKASKEVILTVLKEEKNNFIGLDVIRVYVVDLLIKKYGFKKTDITHCSFWSIGKELFSKIVKHNEKIEKRFGVK